MVFSALCLAVSKEPGLLLTLGPERAPWPRSELWIGSDTWDPCDPLRSLAFFFLKKKCGCRLPVLSSGREGRRTRRLRLSPSGGGGLGTRQHSPLSGRRCEAAPLQQRRSALHGSGAGSWAFGAAATRGMRKDMRFPLWLPRCRSPKRVPFAQGPF